MNPSFCTPPNCTAAVVASQASNIAQNNVWSTWSALDNAISTSPQHAEHSNQLCDRYRNRLFRSIHLGVSENTSFATATTMPVSPRQDGRLEGLTSQTNFTCLRHSNRALVQATSGYTEDDHQPERDVRSAVLQPQIRLNTFMVYSPAFYKGNRACSDGLGSWTFRHFTPQRPPLQVWPGTTHDWRLR